MGDGQRRTKTVNGVTTTYHYNNGMLLSETTGDETLRYYYDSTGKVASIIYKKGDGEETGYFYARNAQGDIIAVYRSKDSKLMGTYEYDLWGRLISATATDDDTDNITNKNPYRYRGYYYDKETGFYYLTARYYDPQIRRFINTDSLGVLMVATIDVACKNLFAYAENNPVSQKDSSGEYVESAFDAVTLIGSVGEVFANPTDIGAWINAGADVVDVVMPVVTGVGEAVRGMRATAKTAEFAENVTDTAKVLNKSSSGSAVSQILSNMPELTGSNRDKLLSTVQDSKLSNIVDQLYRPGAKVGDGGTADKLISEFYQGTSEHLTKAEERLKEVKKIIDSRSLGLNDLDIAEAIRDDLENAINLFK